MVQYQKGEERKDKIKKPRMQEQKWKQTRLLQNPGPSNRLRTYMDNAPIRPDERVDGAAIAKRTCTARVSEHI
jgi:hypothetical protein